MGRWRLSDVPKKESKVSDRGPVSDKTNESNARVTSPRTSKCQCLFKGQVGLIYADENSPMLAFARAPYDGTKLPETDERTVRHKRAVNCLTKASAPTTSGKSHVPEMVLH